MARGRVNLSFAAAIGRRVLEARRARRMTLRDVEKACGVSNAFLSKVENGRTIPGVDSILKIAEALAVPVTSLIEGGASPGIAGPPSDREMGRPAVATGPMTRESGDFPDWLPAAVLRGAVGKETGVVVHTVDWLVYVWDRLSPAARGHVAAEMEALFRCDEARSLRGSRVPPLPGTGPARGEWERARRLWRDQREEAGRGD